MPSDFFEQPIFNSPYTYPSRHWELDDDNHGRWTTPTLASGMQAASTSRDTSYSSWRA